MRTPSFNRRLKAVEQLIRRGATPGEREAAIAARERLLASLEPPAAAVPLRTYVTEDGFVMKEFVSHRAVRSGERVFVKSECKITSADVDAIFRSLKRK